MVANYSFDVKNTDIWAPTFFKHNNSFIATVRRKQISRTPQIPVYYELNYFVVRFTKRNSLKSDEIVTVAGDFGPKSSAINIHDTMWISLIL